jgi:hypothetical protein
VFCRVGRVTPNHNFFYFLSTQLNSNSGSIHQSESSFITKLKHSKIYLSNGEYNVRNRMCSAKSFTHDWTTQSIYIYIYIYIANLINRLYQSYICPRFKILFFKKFKIFLFFLFQIKYFIIFKLFWYDNFKNNFFKKNNLMHLWVILFISTGKFIPKSFHIKISIGDEICKICFDNDKIS